ncbi:MAG: hypothetical protein H3C31_03155 [Brumimicrobium sp.]|nr:hypothetical protein [Brumimicrobium sp.]
MKKIWVTLFVCGVLTSCSRTVYYFSGDYGFFKKNGLTYFISEGILEVTNDHLYQVYEERNGLNNINIDSLLSILNIEIKEKGVQPSSRILKRVKINKIKNGIVFQHEGLGYIDTFKLDIGTYQYDRKLPFPKSVIVSSAVFNQGFTLKFYEDNFTVQYVKDTVFHYVFNESEKVHMFYLYPSLYSSYASKQKKVVDVSEYSDPIILGLSSTNGVPVYVATTKTYFDDDRFVESLKCYKKLKIRGVSRKKLELLLR